MVQDMSQLGFTVFPESFQYPLQGEGRQEMHEMRDLYQNLLHAEFEHISGKGEERYEYC